MIYKDSVVAQRVLWVWPYWLNVPGLIPSFHCRRMLFDTGRLLLIFIAGSFATLIGTLVAFKLLPLASLGSDSWKVRHHHLVPDFVHPSPSVNEPIPGHKSVQA